MTTMISDPSIRTQLTFWIRYVHCKRKSINGWPNNGEWISATKELVTEGPYDDYRQAQNAAVRIMGRDITMPETTHIFPKVERLEPSYG